MTYSHDLRKRALEYIEKGNTKAETSRVFGVTVQTLINWVKRKNHGNLPSNPTRNRQPQKLDSEKLKAYIQEHPDAFLREIAQKFKVSLTTVFYGCKRLKITLKKRLPSTKKGMRKKGRSFVRS